MNQVPCIDLHIHSTASDGSLRPEEIVKEARRTGLTVLALTDHDTLDGNVSAEQAALKAGIRFIHGMEISVNTRIGSVHVLGYGMDDPDAKTTAMLDKIRAARAERNVRIIRNLNLLGFDITVDDVQTIARGDVVGRPHIARALMDRHYVSDFDEAFERFLEQGAVAYVHRWRPSLEDAMEMILVSRGVPVFAHPGLKHFQTYDEAHSFISDLKTAGLMGLEVHYPLHTQSQVDMFTEIAEDLQLIMTGGSDFHGLNRKATRLGHGYMDQPIPSQYADSLLELLDRSSARSARAVGNDILSRRS